AGTTMLKGASETSLGLPVGTDETRTRAAGVAVADTVQARAPAAAGVEAATVCHVVPSSVTSTSTLSTPFEVQAMVWLDPAIQLSPPFGAVTVMVAATSAGSAKSRTMPMCCMLLAPLSVASAGARSSMGL